MKLGNGSDVYCFKGCDCSKLWWGGFSGLVDNFGPLIWRILGGGVLMSLNWSGSKNSLRYRTSVKSDHEYWRR